MAKSKDVLTSLQVIGQEGGNAYFLMKCLNLKHKSFKFCAFKDKKPCDSYDPKTMSLLPETQN